MLRRGRRLPETVRLGVVILAAGASSRMGRPKLLLPWGDTTVIGHLLGQWRSAGAEQVATVIAANNAAVARELDRVGLPPENRIVNEQPERGMFSSVQCAARWPGWNPALSHIAFSLGDQPHLLPSTFTQLLAFAREHPNQLCQPEWQGRPKHPIVFPKETFDRLNVSAAGTMKEFLQHIGQTPGLWSRAFCNVDDPGLDLDIDEPEDYERALRLYFGKA